MGVIGRAKDDLLTPAEFARQVGEDFRAKKIAGVYAAYAEALSKANAVDFDDIIMKTVQLLSKYEQVRDFYQKKFRYILVDEFQDTSRGQNELVRLLAAGHGNIMAVGDDDQSIYRFRGALVENILNFDSAFAKTKTIKLERNYRSTENILNAANAVIANNDKRYGKNLWSSAGAGDKLSLTKLNDQNDEAQYVARTIEQNIREHQLAFKDFAVLCRMNVQAVPLERAFSRAGIPYRILGGLRFNDRKEIKDIGAYLALICNPQDDLRLNRIINVPSRKIGDATMAVVRDIAAREGVSMFDIVERAQDYPALSSASKRLLEFASIIKELRELETTMPLSKFIEQVIERSGYRNMLELAGEVEQERLDNLAELVGNAGEFENTHEEANLRLFLEEAALVSDVDNYDTNADVVVVMTIHSAKGLEFEQVFLPGLEDGIFPGMQSQNDPAELEEERRLAYVALTRAKKRLYLSHTHERMMYGRTSFNPPSRFIAEIPAEYFVEQESRAVNVVNRVIGHQRKTVSNDEKTTIEVFKVGDRVQHSTFGHGDVLSMESMGADILYEIAFDGVGIKKLMGTFARLKHA